MENETDTDTDGGLASQFHPPPPPFPNKEKSTSYLFRRDHKDFSKCVLAVLNDDGEEKEGDYEPDGMFSHSQIRYDSFDQYPKGISKNRHGTRTGEFDYAILKTMKITQARLILGFPDMYIHDIDTDYKPMPKDKEDKGKGKEKEKDDTGTPSSSKNNNGKRPIDESSDKTKRRLVGSVLWDNMLKEIQQWFVLMKICEDGKEYDRFRAMQKHGVFFDPEVFQEFCLFVLDRTQRLPLRTKRELMRGAYQFDDHDDPVGYIPCDSDEYTWGQLRRVLWHAFERVVVYALESHWESAKIEQTELDLTCDVYPWFAEMDDAKFKTLKHPFAGGSRKPLRVSMFPGTNGE